jgi:3-oxoacyl-[acyl-carrier-protein] synthase-3
MTQAAGSLRRAGILGVGSYVPPQVVTNDDLAKRLDTSDDWIASRTGIRARRVAAADVATSDMAAAAGERALADAGLTASDLDLIVVATSTPDYPGSFPSTAAVVQNLLGARQAAAFDLGAVCAGFAYALHVTAQLVRSGAQRCVLVIGAETFSRIINWEDRSTAVLFGDGAGAAVVGEVSDGGYLGGVLGADGSGGPLLQVAAGGSRMPLTASCIESRQNTIFQNGKEVYKFAVSIMGDAAAQAVESVGLQTSDVDLFIPHQANIRIIQKAAERMGLPMERVFVNLDRYGNTSAASIPLALDEAVKAGRIVPGALVVLVGFGAGLTWGANVLRWSGQGQQ